MHRSYHPSGDQHWTRAHPEYRQPWAKLRHRQIEQLCTRFQAGESQSALARAYKIGRTTVWRYLKARGLIGR
jgi:DNA invertase Pin-like site-specific DNA recombinase